MSDKSYLFRLDPAASAAYNMYKASNKNGGSFEDFLLKYDTNKANKGDFSSILGDSENGKMINELLRSSSVSPDALSNAISELKDEKDDLLSEIFKQNQNSYDLLNARANEAVQNAINSANLTKEQKQILAKKYDELTKG
ncbi:hypothetical protein [Campylobacter gastrosuis]|uniref:Uncharacterized protein n=1 Tax=Campylobacter gastrosuis TaxID=2974576 RepID=A0ABT7HRQ0_9BACT|nr:hypothetical protein [Campylobacter gastrosuis]MDL0089390.1 hypothetical protein [Campylobacter gastrosuis]